MQGLGGWDADVRLRRPLGFTELTAANSDDYFQLIGIRQANLCVLAAGHDFAIAFYRNALAGKAEFVQKF